MLTRLAAIVIIAVALTAAAIQFARKDVPLRSSAAAAPALETPGTDPLRATLQHCRALGADATRTAECLEAWDENRRRFLSIAKEN